MMAAMLRSARLELYVAMAAPHPLALLLGQLRVEHAARARYARALVNTARHVVLPRDGVLRGADSRKADGFGGGFALEARVARHRQIDACRGRLHAHASVTFESARSRAVSQLGVKGRRC